MFCCIGEHTYPVRLNQRTRGGGRWEGRWGEGEDGWVKGRKDRMKKNRGGQIRLGQSEQVQKGKKTVRCLDDVQHYLHDMFTFKVLFVFTESKLKKNTNFLFHIPPPPQSLNGCLAKWRSLSVLPRLERVLERSMMVCLLGLLRTERLASDMSAVTRVMDILKQRSGTSAVTGSGHRKPLKAECA